MASRKQAITRSVYMIFMGRELQGVEPCGLGLGLSGSPSKDEVGGLGSGSSGGNGKAGIAF